MSQEWETLAAQIRDLKRQLAEVTAERDQYKAACKLADALRNQQFAPGKVQVVGSIDGPVVVFEGARR